MPTSFDGTDVEFRVGSRNSLLARIQAQVVVEALQKHVPTCHVCVTEISTEGDRDKSSSLQEIGGRGLFSNEINDAVRDGLVDFAVHSAKDLPSLLSSDMCIAAVLPRRDACDALCSRNGYTMVQLPPGSLVGTSSPRRAALVLDLRHDLRVVELRGNVDTRLRKLAEGEVDAALLGAGGLRLLGREEAVTELLDPWTFVPAVGQGAIAVVTRTNDLRLKRLFSYLDHRASRLAVTAERAVLETIGGNCKTPVACYAEVHGRSIRVRAAAADVRAGRVIRATILGSAEDARAAGQALAAKLLAAGADKFVEFEPLQTVRFASSRDLPIQEYERGHDS